MHFVMHAFNNHVMLLHNVTPIDLLVQSAILSDRVVFLCTHHLGQALACPTYIPMLWFCIASRRLTYWFKQRFYFSTAPRNFVLHIDNTTLKYYNNPV